MSETQLIEAYLSGQPLSATDPLLEVRLLLDKDLKEKMVRQMESYALVKAYGRIVLKREIENVHQQLFTERRFENFRKKILSIFNT